MAMSTKEPNESPSGLRFVRLVFLKHDSAQHTPEDWLIPIHSTSTFGDIQEGLVPKYQDQFTVLRTNFGPVPYWTMPEPDSHIGEICQTLYAVRKEDYVLAVVRTSVSDYPIVLNYYSLKNGSTLRDVVTFAAPELRTARITGYSAAIADHSIGCIEEQTDKPHFPTVFIITTDDRRDGFEFDLEPAPEIPSLQLLYLDCKYLLRKSYGVKHCPLQMIHVSSSLVHAVVSVSKLLDAPPDSVNVGAKNLEDVVSSSIRDEEPEVEKRTWYYPYNRAAFAVIKNLTRSCDELTEIMMELENDSIVPVLTEIEAGSCHPAEPRIEKVFFDLCGEHPGAVTIRDSYARFKELKEWDQEEEEQMRRLAQRPFFGLGGRLLKCLWRMLPTWREPPSQLPPPSWSSDADSQDLQTGTPTLQQKLGNGHTGTTSVRLDLATTSKE